MISNVFILYYWDNMKRFVEDALLETNTSATEYWEDKLARDCQKAYQRIRREITQVHEDFFGIIGSLIFKHELMSMRFKENG